MKPVGSEVIPDWVERWFAQPAHGLDAQDWDLILMERRFLPLMFSYLESPEGVLEKKFTIVSALAEMLFLERGENSDTHAVSQKVADEIKSVLARNKDLSLAARPQLGIKANILIMMIVGSPLTAEIGRWPWLVKECEAALT